MPMFWQEPKTADTVTVPDDVVDVAFDIACRCLPVDHAYALQQGLRQALPWLSDDPRVGIHPIHVAESGNGWMRPENPQDLLHLSRRTKLMLRIPKERLDDTRKLSGHTLDVAGHELRVDKSTVRLLLPISTVFSRYIVAVPGQDETQFLHNMAAQLRELGIKPKKMLCGRESRIVTPENSIHARSVMLAELSLDESIQLQLRGLGLHRQLGCGLFIGHKDIAAVKQEAG